MEKQKKPLTSSTTSFQNTKRVGDFELDPVRTRVALVAKMRFCSINKIGKDFIDVHFVLTKEYNESKCFYKIDNLGDRFFVHHIKIFNWEDINSEVIKYMRLAYEVGNRQHVKSKK